MHITHMSIPQTMLPLIKQMSEVIASGKYGVLVMANLEGAFDAICRNGANYKLHKAGLRNKWVLVFLSFLNDRHSRNLVTS